MKRLIIYCDGASRGNPGEASIGVVLQTSEGRILEEHSSRVGVTTNNRAEYNAVIKSLQLARKHTKEGVKLFSDSELVVKQLNGEYKVKSEALKKLYDEVKVLEEDFTRVEYEHVKREKNTKADELANKALDEGLD